MSINSAVGFSLVEVLISSVVLSIGALGLISLQGSLRSEFQQLQVQQQALYLARQKQQDLRVAAQQLNQEHQLEYLTIKDNTGGRLPAGEILEKEQTPSSMQFERYWQVTAKNWEDSDADGIKDAWKLTVAPENSSHIKSTKVTILWKDPQGSLRSITHESSVAPFVIVPVARILALGEQASRTPNSP